MAGKRAASDTLQKYGTTHRTRRNTSLLVSAAPKISWANNMGRISASALIHILKCWTCSNQLTNGVVHRALFTFHELHSYKRAGSIGIGTQSCAFWLISSVHTTARASGRLLGCDARQQESVLYMRPSARAPTVQSALPMIPLLRPSAWHGVQLRPAALRARHSI